MLSRADVKKCVPPDRVILFALIHGWVEATPATAIWAVPTEPFPEHDGKPLKVLFV